MFDALGHPRRIAIFLALQKAGPEGLTFGVLAAQAKIAQPSLAHHLKMMKKGGIVYGQRKGSSTIITLDQSQLVKALKFLRS